MDTRYDLTQNTIAVKQKKYLKSTLKTDMYVYKHRS